MTVKSLSVLYPLDEMPPAVVQGIRDRAIDTIVAIAQDELGPATPLIVRDLQPTDVGLSNNEWTETSGSDNEYATTGINNAIGDERFLAIWGCRILTAVAVTPIVVEQRISVGGSVVAKWNLYPLWQIHDPDTTEAVLMYPRAGISEHPVYVRQNLTLKVEEYSNVATTTYKLAFEGVTVEKVGNTLNL